MANRDDNQENKLKVFVSYARKDHAFAERLVAALERRGMQARIDVRDLPSLEDWRRELLGFIQEADAIVFVISPHSVASPVCGWEIARVAELNKRLAPIVLNRVSDDNIPEAAAKINYLYFDPPNEFETQADKLAEALQTDLVWLKEHTRIGELAHRWEQRERAATLLLRGNEIKIAEDWLLSRPKGAPDPTPGHQAFIATSRQGETVRQRRTVWLSISAAVIATALTAATVVQWRTAVEQRQLAEQNRSEAERNLDTAIDTTKSFVTSLASDLKGIAGLPTSKVSEILDTAKTQFDRIAESAPDNPKLLQNKASLYLVYAETYQEIGKSAEALERARAALTIVHQLVAAYPDEADYARLASVAEARIAMIEGRPAVTANRVAEARIAAKTHPDAPDYQRDLAVALNALGDRQRDTGEIEAALTSYNEALAIVTELNRQYGYQGLVKSDLAISYDRLGNLYIILKQNDAAIKSYQKALKVSEEIAFAEPGKTEWQRNLAVSHEKLGETQFAAANWQAALDEYKKSLLLREQLLRGDPQNLTWKSDIAMSLSHLANVWLALNQRDKAQASEQQSLEIVRSIVAAEKTFVPQHRQQLEIALNHIAGYLYDSGNIEKALAHRREALSIARDLAGFDPAKLPYQSDLFFCLTNVAATTSEREEAIRLISEARNYYQRLNYAGGVSTLLRKALTDALINALTNESYLHFIARAFEESERVDRELIALAPDKPFFQTLLAGALMFQDKIAAADEIYLKHRNETINGKSWAEFISMVFAQARARGYSHPHMAWIEAKLRKGSRRVASKPAPNR